MFQRRHYTKVAELLKRQRMHYSLGYRRASNYMIMAFVTMFENDNPNFDRSRFLKACAWADKSHWDIEETYCCWKCEEDSG